MKQSTLLNVNLWSGREKKKREIGMARKRAENRERSLGFPGFNIVKDNWGRWKQHSRTLRGSFMAPRKPRVLTLEQS
ncbi:hypothetical protein TNCV_3298441 [Trichonephila clavipes]|uniref:Uncharacterized protein n=1 Tax=Trichonephila clavipes TaxID=2585209 RepID=A0A8X7B7E2_TRICX|nr:hypothetical protein TNCV_3298441 [Trichonephila clavipes]